MPSEVFRITLAYEQGYGQGLKSTYSNPYKENTDEYEAWEIGYSEGLKSNPGAYILKNHDRKNTIYISGPMSGHDNYNFEAFNSAARNLSRFGFKVVNPADIGVDNNASWEDYLRHQLARMMKCSTIYMLPGWEKSKGAVIENAIAKLLNMNITGSFDY